MSNPGTGGESPPQPQGVVERLVRDDADRKRFLKMAGSAGAASFGAFVLAACGSKSSSSSSSSASSAPATTRRGHLVRAAGIWRSSTTR